MHATTQEHGVPGDKSVNAEHMNDRPIYRETSIEEYKKQPKVVEEMSEVPELHSIYPEWTYEKGNQWGMAIDLTSCTGCNACVVACQAENNIPVVGKEQVLHGREMHWIRMDRYYTGPEDDPQLVEQPVPCMQCENAPCENVCPVAATTHSPEGLNDMAYNRCVGTRYCAQQLPVQGSALQLPQFPQARLAGATKLRRPLYYVILLLCLFIMSSLLSHDSY